MNVLLQQTIALWQEGPDSPAPIERTFPAGEQAAREAQLDRFLESVQAELRSLPRTRRERSEARERISSAFERFARTALDFEDPHLDLLVRGGFSAVGTSLARQARHFDPAVTIADILQACRNAWTACGLQALVGRPMQVTPAIFAYSMLYPYTDNYLDDFAASRADKLGFSARFGRRLAGEAVAPANERESAIWRLIGLIEGQYDRATSPQVFQSLLAIHRAQENSLRLLRQRPSAGAVNVLTLSFAKGGASVMADGHLAAGSLSEAEADFVFAWGVLLQLADDLQDVRQDCRDGALTLFSQAAGHEPLDALTNRTLHFAERVMRKLDRLPGADCRALKELIRRSSTSLLIRCAGEAGEFYTRDYLAELETHSPFRYSFLNDRRHRLARYQGPIFKLFDAFLEGDEDEPAFPFLPSSQFAVIHHQLRKSETDN